MLPKATQLIAQSTQLDDFKTQYQRTAEEQFTLSISSLYPIATLTRVLHAAHTTFPLLQLTVTVDTLAGTQKVEDGRVDMAITEEDWISPTLHHNTCHITPMILVGHSPTLSTTHSPQIILKSSTQTPVKDRSILPHARQWYASDMTTKKQLICAGFGWGFLPEHLITKELTHNQLYILHVPSLPPTQVTLSTIRRQSTGPVSDFFWDNL